MTIRFLGIKKSDHPDKKYYAEFESEGRTRKTYFGAKGMKDFTTFSPVEREERKRRYLARHRANENWNDPESAGALSRWILWNKPTVRESVKDYMKRFHFA